VAFSVLAPCKSADPLDDRKPKRGFLCNTRLDEDSEYQSNQPHDGRGADQAACTLSALRNQAEEHNGSKEGENTAANVFPADPDYRGIDVEA